MNEMTNDAAVAWAVPGAFDPTTRRHSWVDVWTHRREPFTDPLYSATTVAELRAEIDALRGEVERRKSAQAALSQYASAAEQRADAAERRVAEAIQLAAEWRREATLCDNDANRQPFDSFASMLEHALTKE